ncbi:beta-glycosyltransferase [Ligilactobacillus hayakitensis DSM 18933 = JCM 14209]|uniref:Beta-glycosyltransferase n=1 Tax=Ligilactobacillus hayakitensis DSM 18933 = JCM 14209 TaxID=1423755 RepID=A0A0R1WQU4_9LACO|nr:glycosyltransferase family A protein [Ligilactobacillus hayakitensis]KRM20130.1 beta-glycosyltransferase [Ligilactobacillus hayakitensis DSM 18933 = JCM 14209]
MNDSNKVSIITTVYNRKAMIQKLYNSLKEQKNKNFDWVVIDDGSTENIEKLVKKWKSENIINIKFKRVQNGGKMRAYKIALSLLETEYSIVVDSDDVLTTNAVEIILKEIKTSSENEIGFIFPRNEVNAKWNRIHRKNINIIELKAKYGIIESAIVINNAILKQNFTDDIFSVNEKFVSEEVLYNKFIEYGKFKVILKKIYISEYQLDGLTNKIFELWLKNPEGTLKLLNSRYNALDKCQLSICKKVIEKAKVILNLNAFCMIKNKNINENTPSIIFSLIMYMPSILVKKRFL